jgi:hypothetical protein
MIKAIGNGVKVKGWEMIGWFGLLNYREAVSYTLCAKSIKLVVVVDRYQQIGFHP